MAQPTSLKYNIYVKYPDIWGRRIGLSRLRKFVPGLIERASKMHTYVQSHL